MEIGGLFMDFSNNLNFKIEKINEQLKSYLKSDYPDIIYEAMNYSVFSGGKRLRPIILISCCETLGGNITDALPFACALEMIHTYSLIHDDLPAMDNDDYRRGRKTCHKEFTEAIAILAGDALLNKAFEVMSEVVLEKFEKKFVKAMNIIACSSGVKGMIGGQTADIIFENKEIDKETLLYIHEHKTGALISAAAAAGAVLGNADDKKIKLFNDFGNFLGLAFQIKDDILDITSTTEVLGKPVHSDEKNSKNTYVSMFGLKKAEKDQIEYSEKAAEIAKGFGENGKFIYEFTKSLVNRIK